MQVVVWPTVGLFCKLEVLQEAISLVKGSLKRHCVASCKKKRRSSHAPHLMQMSSKGKAGFCSFTLGSSLWLLTNLLIRIPWHTYHRMGHETFSIFCDEPWNFVEEFRMGHQKFRWKYHFPLRPTLAVTLWLVPKRYPVKTSSDQNVLGFSGQNVLVSSDQNVLRPKRPQTKTSSDQNVLRPKRPYVFERNFFLKLKYHLIQGRVVELPRRRS